MAWEIQYPSSVQNPIFTKETFVVKHRVAGSQCQKRIFHVQVNSGLLELEKTFQCIPIYDGNVLHQTELSTQSIHILDVML